MKKIAALLLSGALLLVSAGLIAQPTAYSADVAFSQNPSSPYASNQINWLRSYSDAVALSQSSAKPIVLLFTGTGWCPACMKLERDVLKNPAFAQAVGQRFVFLKAEFPDYSEGAIKNSPFKPLLDRYGVNAFPTIVVINANGQQLYTVNYQQGGPNVYIQELLQKLNQTQRSMPNPASYR